MNGNKYTYFYNSTTSKINKKFVYLLLIFSILTLGSAYELYKYNNFMNDFELNFNNGNFASANNILISQELNNPFKNLKLNKDLNNFFNNKVEELSNSISANDISSEDILTQLREIERYNIIPHETLVNISNSIDILQSSSSNYNNGITAFNNGDYTNAISDLRNVSPLDLNYNESLKYINDSKEQIKNNLFAYCDELADKDYYSQALSILSDNSNLIGSGSDVKDKISELKTKQQEYLDKNTSIAEASSSALTSNITPENINDLNIESNTSYFINVNLDSQKTYIYKGKADNWKLVKSCPCSTGISGEDTPSGSFSTQEKGEWFFSEKYQQGGKYWTQITGDILFHSVPFAKDKNTVVDYTLNSPSSHGCIRLSIDDAKWIYNNIPKGSKIIIK